MGAKPTKNEIPNEIEIDAKDEPTEIPDGTIVADKPPEPTYLENLLEKEKAADISKQMKLLAAHDMANEMLDLRRELNTFLRYKRDLEAEAELAGADEDSESSTEEYELSQAGCEQNIDEQLEYMIGCEVNRRMRCNKTNYRWRLDKYERELRRIELQHAHNKGSCYARGRFRGTREGPNTFPFNRGQLRAMPIRMCCEEEQFENCQMKGDFAPPRRNKYVNLRPAAPRPLAPRTHDRGDDNSWVRYDKAYSDYVDDAATDDYVTKPRHRREGREKPKDSKRGKKRYRREITTEGPILTSMTNVPLEFEKSEASVPTLPRYKSRKKLKSQSGVPIPPHLIHSETNTSRVNAALAKKFSFVPESAVDVPDRIMDFHSEGDIPKNLDLPAKYRKTERRRTKFVDKNLHLNVLVEHRDGDKKATKLSRSKEKVPTNQKIEPLETGNCKVDHNHKPNIALK